MTEKVSLVVEKVKGVQYHFQATSADDKVIRREIALGHTDPLVLRYIVLVFDSVWVFFLVPGNKRYLLI